MDELRHRDHAIALQCDASDDVGRLHCWLNRLADSVTSEKEVHKGWFSEDSAAIVMRILAAGFGFISMAGFLLAYEKGLINVFMFLLLFVLIQVLFCLVSTFVMIMSWLGNAPIIFPLNIAKLVVRKTIPDKRYLCESQSVVRVLLLRYGHEFGAIFTLGAVMAFFTVLAFNDFAFVWGSTFNISDEFVQRFTTLLSLPWSSWLPEATLSEQVIAESRYNPALTDLVHANVASMHGWWPFLIMAMLFYALLPRIALWVSSKLIYKKLMRRSFVQYPGSESVLLRMKSPLVSTQAPEPEQTGDTRKARIPTDDSLMLLSWKGAIDARELEQYEEVRIVPHKNVVSAGLGTLVSDQHSVDRINEYQPARLLVVVKAWEPHMTDLADFLDELEQISRCTLYLIPLPDRTVTDLQMQDWSDFSRELQFDAVDTQPLHRV